MSVPFDSLKSFPGVFVAWQNSMGGQGSFPYIEYTDTSGVKYYSFHLGWGMSNGHTWKYKVYPDCSIEFLGVMKSFYDPYPEPLNCRITGIPHPAMPFNEIEVYPNPAKEMVTISVNSHEAFSFRIMDYFGRTLLSGNGKEKCQVSLTSLSQGLYLVYLLKDNSLIGNVKLVIF